MCGSQNTGHIIVRPLHDQGLDQLRETRYEWMAHLSFKGEAIQSESSISKPIS